MLINSEKLILFYLTVLILGWVSDGGAAELRVQELSSFEGAGIPKRSESEIIVQFKDTMPAAVREQMIQKHGCKELRATGPQNQAARFMRLQIPASRTVEEMVAKYRKQPEVEYAEPDYFARALWVPNDTYYAYQWHLDDEGIGGIQMEAAWDLQTGDPEVVIAVIDTGVAYETYLAYQQAPDLANTLFVAGYDFVNNDSHPNDDHGHGTHVAGTLAQSTNNQRGVAGVAFGCSIMPVKVLDKKGNGNHTTIANGIYFAVDQGAKVINMSLGGDTGSITLRNAVQYAYEHGVTVVCAAGNAYWEGNAPSYPAAYDDYCIAVGATRYDQARAYYSNTGSYLDLAAPGGDVTVDQNGDGYGDGILQQTFSIDPTNFSYWFYQGTSMACPHVAGVAGLLITNGVSEPDAVREALEQTTTDLGDAGWDESYGWGLLNASEALRYFRKEDLNGDHQIDIGDLLVFAQQWLGSEPPDLRADLDDNGFVDLRDFTILAANWLN